MSALQATARGKLVFTDEMLRAFFLTPAAKSIKPDFAMSLKPDEAFERFSEVRWAWNGGKKQCVWCGGDKLYEFGRVRLGLYRCKACARDFSTTSKTVFASRKMPHKSILAGIGFRLHEGLNAHQLHLEIGVTYKTAWAFAKQCKIYAPPVDPKARWPYLNENRGEANALVLKVNKLVARDLPEQVRADVAQDLILGVLAGDFSEDELAAHVKKCVTKHYRTIEKNQFRDLSWDAPVPGTDGGRWDDLVSSERYDEAREWVR